ncbi:Tn3 family transposase [Streptomyces sp. NPDC102395]|uniref:Tn3 family transposase n=1 Tax=Streptomyces sp. NPDC102395 TaxID=3366168 RepID=UPI0037F19369
MPGSLQAVAREIGVNRPISAEKLRYVLSASRTAAAAGRVPKDVGRSDRTRTTVSVTPVAGLVQVTGVSVRALAARAPETSMLAARAPETSMLTLHLLQSALVHVNTLLVQQVLAEPAWASRLSGEDRRGLTALFWSNVDPYGTFRLDMDKRPDLGPATVVPRARAADRPRERRR